VCAFLFGIVGDESLFEVADNPSIIRRIASALAELAKASLRPLRHKAVRLLFVRDFVLFYFLMFLLLHFIGYRSWHPEFHKVHEAFRDSAITSIPLALLGAVLSYFSLLRERDWL
jgi:hypothetical protein